MNRLKKWKIGTTKTKWKMNKGKRMGSLDYYENLRKIENKIAALTADEKKAMRKYTSECADILIKNSEEEISRAGDGWSLWKPSYKDYPKSPVESLDIHDILDCVEVEPPYGQDFYSDMHEECVKFLKANYQYDFVYCSRNSFRVVIGKYEEVSNLKKWGTSKALFV